MDNKRKLTIMDQVIDIIETTEDPQERSQKIKKLGLVQTEQNEGSNAYASKYGDLLVVDFYELNKLRIYEMVHYGTHKVREKEAEEIS